MGPGSATGPQGEPRINRTVTEEGAAGRVLIDQQSASGHYYLDTWHHLALGCIGDLQINYYG